ncbi:MAG TPA: hypothetical protein PLD09_02205 [Methanomassiliicoccaceae archaeon]|nr:hypothetical protein [Methanomassiliicoccaceae archaeon]HOQ25688.1 hypothetical protein [Methanomassiliicoccaceae archaeon]HQA20669.1 hypothetical protein [Methanomassiliicoccaceae archaeon]HQD87197.1 hypothetical protein [Methanomassiliicoccaceae archaeon]
MRKRSRIRDEATSSLVRNGVYHIADTYDDIEAKKFDGPVVYSFWSAMKYTFALSLLLWWLPVFGQMVAGYVGGRRAGSPSKGVVAAIIPVAFFFLFDRLVDMGIMPTVWFGIELSPAAIMALVGTYLPVIQPYLEFVNMYLTSFFSSLQTATELGFDSYIITVAFAYIGGVLSLQNRRELELLAKMSRGNNTTVVLEGNTFQTAPVRSRRMDRRFSDMGAIDADIDHRGDVGAPRSFRKAMYDEELLDSLSIEERRLLKEWAQELAAQQRQLERKVRQAAEQRPLRPRTADDNLDWEFI